MLPDRFLSQGTFNVETENLVVHEKSVYTLENMKINIRTYQGTVKQSLSLSETEGFGLGLDLLNLNSDGFDVLAVQ